MLPSQLPLNALRAFEAAARHLSFTRAGLELRVTQAAVSHQVKALEAALGAPLFRRLPRGLALTAEAEALLPALSEALRLMSGAVERARGRAREVLTLGVVGTFATGWLLPRLPKFRADHPYVDLRLFTNNNRVDLAGEGLDAAVRFGDGAWHGTEAVPLLDAPFAPLCAPALAHRLRRPADLAGESLLRSYRLDEWERWFAAAGVAAPPVHGSTSRGSTSHGPVACGPMARGFVFDSSLTMAEAAVQGAGVALLPARLFAHELRAERLARPFAAEVSLGRYWLTRLKSRPEGAALAAFRAWLLRQCAGP